MAGLLLAAGGFLEAEPPLPPPADRSIAFDRDIRPILERSCIACHGGERIRGGLDLRERDSLLQGGSSGAAVQPGDSARSLLIRSVAGLEEDLEMPPPGRGERLSPGEIGLLRAWIDQGVPWEETGSAPIEILSYQPTASYIHVEGDAQRFREHWQAMDGASGGIGDLWYRSADPDGTRIQLRARSLHPALDQAVDLEILRPDLGYISLEYRGSRHHYDNSGGFHPRLPSLALDRELALDASRIRLELGLAPADSPYLILGYERRYRHGEKSTLQRGPVFLAGEPALALYPAFRQIGEDTHAVDMEIGLEWRGWALSDALRAETTRLATRATRAESATAGDAPEVVSARSREELDQISLSNSLKAERQIRPWWLLSAGYLATHMNAEAGFDLETLLPRDWSADPVPGDHARQILLSRNSHILNLGSGFRLAPGWSLWTGAEGDWTRQSGQGDLWIFDTWPAGLGSTLDRFSRQMRAGLRFNRLRNHVLYADARHEHALIGQREDQRIHDGFEADNDFLRHTDATLREERVLAGWNWILGRRLSLRTRIRSSRTHAGYHHPADTDSGPRPGLGYPGFVRSRNTRSDDLRLQLVARPASWLQSTLSWSRIRTEYFLAVAQDGSPLSRPAGEHSRDALSLFLAAHPGSRVRISGILLWSGFRAKSVLDRTVPIPPYQGESLSVSGSLAVQLSKGWSWDLRGLAARSDADRIPDPAWLAAPWVHDRHGVVSGLSRSLAGGGVLQIQYGLFRYRGAPGDRYRAHGISLAFRKAFPRE